MFGRLAIRKIIFQLLLYYLLGSFLNLSILHIILSAQKYRIIVHHFSNLHRDCALFSLYAQITLIFVRNIHIIHTICAHIIECAQIIIYLVHIVSRGKGFLKEPDFYKGFLCQPVLMQEYPVLPAFLNIYLRYYGMRFSFPQVWQFCSTAGYK